MLLPMMATDVSLGRLARSCRIPRLACQRFDHDYGAIKVAFNLDLGIRFWSRLGRLLRRLSQWWLAQRSASAAKEIKGLIDDSVNTVRAGTELVGEAGRTMQEVVGSVRRVTDIVGEIAAASHEQSIGIEQVNQAITQIDQVTQQNAALVEQAAAAAGSLQDQAGSLVEVVGAFRLESGVNASDGRTIPVLTTSAVKRREVSMLTLSTVKAHAPTAGGSPRMNPALLEAAECTEF